MTREFEKSLNKINKMRLKQVKKVMMICILVLISQVTILQAQAIDPLFFGQNYWYADQGTDFTGPVWAKVVASGCTIMRYGGIAPNSGTGGNPIEIASEFRTLIVDRFNTNGVTPIVQLPFSGNFTTLSAQASFAYDVVADLSSNGYPGLIYSIGNEPDIPTGSGGYGYNLSSANLIDENLIVQYVKAFAEKIKEADETALIIAPCIASFNDGNKAQIDSIFNNTSFTYGNLGGIISGNPNPLADGKNHVDIASFHLYPSATITTCGAVTCVGDRAEIIDYPSASFEGKLSTLQSYIGSREIAVTEYSSTGCNELCSDWDANPVIETDARSFIGGQMIADLMSVGMASGSVKCMNMWSVKESGPDRGYLISSSGKERSSYWHFQTLAENFKDTYLPNSYANSANYKGFAYENTSANEIGVVIMNQDLQSPRGSDNSTNTFRINFNNSVSGAYDMKFAFTCGLSVNYDCTIMNETTMILFFNATTGAFVSSKAYSLQDALRANDIGPSTWGGTSAPINDQTEYNNHPSSQVYTDIDITTSSAITASSDKVFLFTNTATIDATGGTFSSGTGQTLTITPSANVTCH